MQTLQPEKSGIHSLSTTKQTNGVLTKAKSLDPTDIRAANKRGRKNAGADANLKLIPGPAASKFFGDYRTYVDHTYHDFADADDPEDFNKSFERDKFPAKLHALIDFAQRSEKPVRDPETGKDILLREVIYWKPHGRAFAMTEGYKHILQSHLLGMFFGSNKFLNFQRQLNLYDFKHLVGDECKLAYYHECFLRTRIALTSLMVRTPCKRNGYKPLSLPELEPKFHEMPYLPDPYTTSTSNQLKPNTMNLSDLDNKSITKFRDKLDHVPKSSKFPQGKKRILEDLSSNPSDMVVVKKGVAKFQRMSDNLDNSNQQRKVNYSEPIFDLPDIVKVSGRSKANHRNVSTGNRNVSEIVTEQFTRNLSARPKIRIAPSTTPTHEEVVEVVREVEMYRTKGTVNREIVAEDLALQSVPWGSGAPVRQIIYASALRSEDKVMRDIEDCVARLRSLEGELDLVRQVDEATKLTASTVHSSNYDHSSSTPYHTGDVNTTYVVDNANGYCR